MHVCEQVAPTSSSLIYAPRGERKVLVRSMMQELLKTHRVWWRARALQSVAPNAVGGQTAGEFLAAAASALRRCVAAPASGPRLLGHHHLDELLIVDLAITVDIGLTDHLIDLLVRQLLAEIRHHMAQLRRAD